MNKIFLDNLNKLNFDSKNISLDLQVKSGSEFTFEYEDTHPDVYVSVEKSTFENNIIIKNKNNGFMTDFFGININTHRSLTGVLTIPSFVDNFFLNITNGDISINDLNLNKTFLRSVTGDLYVNNCNFNNAEIKIITGDFLMKHSTVEKLDMKLTTGDAKLKHSKIYNACISVLTGDLIVDTLPENFKNFELKVVTGDAKIFVDGDKDIYLSKKLTPYTSSLKSNVNFVEEEGDHNERNMDIKLVTGNIKFIKSQNKKTSTKNTKSTNQDTSTTDHYEKIIKEKIESTELLTEEEKKIKNLFNSGKISKEFAIELLIKLDYPEIEAKKFLESEGV